MWQHGGETPKLPGWDQPGFQTGAFLIVRFLGNVQDVRQLLRQDRTHQRLNPRIRPLPRTDIPFSPRRTAHTLPHDCVGYHCQFCLSRSFSLSPSAKESDGISRSDALGCRRRRRRPMLLRSMLTGTARFQGSFGKWHRAEGTAFLYRRTSWDHAWAALFFCSRRIA